MNESRLTKRIYRANVCDGKVGKGYPRKFCADHIGGILKKSAKCESNSRAEDSVQACSRRWSVAPGKRTTETRFDLCRFFGTAEHEGVMGQQDYVTAHDWLRTNRHYNCPGAWD
ncbi:hypothetical protein EVAR_94184_1 [Eumeta japonica]|uniref:Uncharacterized protein n=1 Tax=Eumeta variegata TaxID=151549 RepID=A0A4C1UP85_EUMVA|nr:hypothetical protein EVAR_94184_1 [Eumeta japonica]